MRYRNGPPARLRPATRRRRRRWRIAGLVALVLLIGFGAATARLFVLPARGMPARVDAIVMMNGPRRAGSTPRWTSPSRTGPALVISRGNSYYGQGDFCAARCRG